MNTRTQQGITLVELVAVIVVMAIVMTYVMQTYSHLARAANIGLNNTTLSAYAESCLEHIRIMRQDPARGYSDPALAVTAAATACDALPLSAGLSRTVNISIPASPPCLSGASCKAVAVTLSNGNVSETEHLLLFDY